MAHATPTVSAMSVGLSDQPRDDRNVVVFSEALLQATSARNVLWASTSHVGFLAPSLFRLVRPYAIEPSSAQNLFLINRL